MGDPFFITGPALISFSGGRTSGYMLWRILQAHGGTLPPDVYVVFANTGKEREETLAFVKACADYWGVSISWLEYAAGAGRAVAYRVVTFDSAARQGEPFSALNAAKKFVPSSPMRFCTSELKINTMAAFMRARGHDAWKNIVGLRSDEGWRVMKALDQNYSGKYDWVSVMPLSKAGIRADDIKAFWLTQQFTLNLERHEGNCDLCFLKNRRSLERMMRDNPGIEAWWVEEEQKSNRQFIYGESYAQIRESVERQPLLFEHDDVTEHEVECGLHCAPDAVEDTA